ncbi:MAG: rubrerythrin [Deltaproteobacteria bacterium]|nr:rubrerythrin [Deltaproteobacteria bacterium]
MSQDTDRLRELRYVLEVATLAIPREREARDRYLGAARRAPGEMARRIFEEMARQEEQHEAQLRALITHLEEELAR